MIGLNDFEKLKSDFDSFNRVTYPVPEVWQQVAALREEVQALKGLVRHLDRLSVIIIHKGGKHERK
jgi:hypothetical protein